MSKETTFGQGTVKGGKYDGMSAEDAARKCLEDNGGAGRVRCTYWGWGIEWDEDAA